MFFKRYKTRFLFKPRKRFITFLIAFCTPPVMLGFIIVADQNTRNYSSHQSYQNLKEFDSVQLVASSKSNNSNWNYIEARIAERNDHLQKNCKRLGLNKLGDDPLHKPNPWEYLINKEHHLVYCNVFKSASTTWLYNFNILAGYKPEKIKRRTDSPVALARKRYSRPNIQELENAFKNSFSFLIVRHPLERILSAYRDKLENKVKPNFYSKLSRNIVEKYRNEADKKKLASQKYPTFSEFVHFVLDGNKDEHWAPITTFCTPCFFNFTVIAHTETLTEDQNYIIYKSGIDKMIKPEWRNKGNEMTASQIEKYYSQLTKLEIMQLYNFYRYDFELFNYSLIGYIEFGRSELHEGE